MRKTVKTALGIILALVLTIGVIPPAPAEAADHFDDMVIDGVTYYDLLGSTQSYFTSGFDQFVQQYLTTRPGFGNYSVQEKWAEVAHAIVEAAQQNDSNTHNDWYTAKQELDLSTFGDTAQSGFGIAGSQYGEVEAMGVAFQQIQEKSGKAHNFYPTKDGEITTLLGMDPGLCMYYWRLGDNNSGQKLYDSVAIVFSNFRFAHVVNGEYLQNNVMSRQDYSLNLGEPTTTYSDVYTNNTAQTAQVSSGLKTDVTESVTMSQSHTETFNYGASVTVSTELSFGTGQDWFAGAQWKIGVSATASWSAALSDNFGSSKTYTNTGGSTSTISAALPPYTEARILKSVGEGKMALKFDMPTMLLYDVSICFPPITDMDRPRYVCYTTYKTSADRNSANAREDLHQRVLNHASEPQDVHNDDDYLRTWAGMVWEKVPVSKAVVDMGYTINYSDSNLSDIRPIANLKKVEMKDKRSAMDLKVGEPLDVSTVEVVGLNEMNNPFYGFDDALGSWSLLDENGDPIPDNKNQYIKLEEDAVTKRVMLTALQPGGTVFLHYNVPDNTYIDVERTAAGASATETFYTHPEDVKNLATLTVHTVTTSESYKITAEGEVAGYVGDAPVALSGENSPVTACVLDANGDETDRPVTWAVRKDNGVIAIDGENNLSFLKEGQNAIRAEWGSLHSEWLPVTVNAERQVAAVTLSDPKGILADWHIGDGASSRTYETKDLTFTCLDQYGNPMDEILGRPLWDIRKNGEPFISFGDPDHFWLDSAGEYGVTVTVNRVESNMLTFNIGAPATLAALALSDDPDEPYLADYCLHDRPDDTFDLTQLTVEGRDQYGEPTAFDPTGLTWLVNGNALQGSALTVQETGTYKIQCQAGDAAALQSNVLTLRVLPASYYDNLTVVTLPKASAITYGQALADSTLTGGVVRLKGDVIPGTFVWKDDQIEPAVSDSKKTAYDAVFMPDEPQKYGTVPCAVRLTVNKAAASVEAPPAAASNLAYNGQPQKLIVAGAAKGGEMAYVIGTDGQTAPVGGWTTAIPMGIDAGTYYVWYKVLGDANHNDTDPACVAATILNDDVTPEAPKPGALVYNGQAQELVTAGKTNGGTMVYALGTDATTAPTDGWSEDVPTGTNAGTYYVWYKVLGDANHNDTDPASLEVTIARKPLTVTAEAKEKTYGDADPELTYAVDGLVEGDVLTGALTRTEGEVVGSYAIRQGTLAASANYALAFNEALFTIKAKAATVTAQDQTITEGEAIATGVDVVTLSGAVQGHALGAVTLTATGADKAGTGKITPSAAKIVDAAGNDVTGNYSMTYVDGTLTVNEKPRPEPQPDYTLLTRLTVTSTSMKLDWTKVPEADGYDVYFTECNKDFSKLDSVKGADTCRYRIKGLTAGTCYKAYVKAWKKVNGKKVTIGKASPTVHAIVGGYNDTHCNARSVKLNKGKLTLRAGKSYKLKATVKGVKRGRKPVEHVSLVRYYSSDTNVAKVSSSGKVKAVGKGSCKIWAIANNGVRTSATVNVK